MVAVIGRAVGAAVVKSMPVGIGGLVGPKPVPNSWTTSPGRAGLAAVTSVPSALCAATGKSAGANASLLAMKILLVLNCSVTSTVTLPVAALSGTRMLI